MRKLCTLLLCCLITASQLLAQTKTITGKVSDENKKPISNASVLIKGSSKGTTTLNDGTFSIVVPDVAKTLIVTSIGFVAQDVAIKNSLLIITLQSSTSSLDEVVVVGYGTKKKSEFIGSAATLNSKDFADRPVTNVINALAGSAPGIQTSSTGQPGAALAIRIRGYGSISAANGPLIVVDGSPYEGNIAQIRSEDVESLTTLKDANTTALYGSRAANGVIMITTKSGSVKKGNLSFQASRGFVTRQIAEYDRVDPSQYYTLMWEAMRNSRLSLATPLTPVAAATYATANIAGASGLKYNPFNVAPNQVVDESGTFNPNAKLIWGDDLDWAKDITRVGKREDYGLSYSGGANKMDYYASVGYTNDEGYIINSGLKKYSGRLKINAQPASWIKSGINLGYTYTNSSNTSDGTSTAFVNPFFFARNIGPIYPVFAHNITTGDFLFDALGNKLYDYSSDMVSGNRPSSGFGGRHVVAETKFNNSGTTGSLLSARTYVDLNLSKDLIFTVNFGGDINTSNNGTYQNNLVGDGAPSGILDKSQLLRRTYTFNQLLKYKKKIKSHSLSFLAGHENYDYYLLTTNQQKQNQAFSGVYELDNFFVLNSMDSRTDTRRIESYFGSANYDFGGKYFVSASLRRDGNSRFSTGVRWQNFYGLSAGWLLTNENFMKKISWVNSLKLRSSYGAVGNDEIGTNYAYQATYALGYTNAGTEGGALLQTARPNPNVTWEENKTFDIGTEFSLFNNRITGSIEWYNRLTSRMLFNFAFPPSAGGNASGSFSEFQNIGSSKNTGLEIDLHADVIRTKFFKWNIGFNASTLKNTITAMPETSPTIISGTKQYAVGHSIYDYWLREWMGVDPSNGNALYRALTTTISSTTFANKDGDIVTTDINNAKKFYAGTAIPDLYGGISTSISYKFIELSVRLKYQLGGSTYDGAYTALMHSGNYGAALSTDVLQRWQKVGDITNVPRMDANKVTDFGAGTSSRWLTNASFINLENVTLTYELDPKILRKINASKLRFFLSADNLGFLVSRNGMNPNQGFSGVTSNVYLPARIFSTGFNINF